MRALKMQPFAPATFPAPGDSNSAISATTFDQGRVVPVHSAGKIPPGRFTKFRKPRVLVVEDEPISRRTLAGLLRDEGCNVLEAADGLQGLSAAAQTRPDLVITDLWMPVQDGFGLILSLRGLEKCRTVPIIVVTGDADPAARAQALQMGADRVLEKPVDVALLLAIARETAALARVRRLAGAGPAIQPTSEPPPRDSGRNRKRDEGPRPRITAAAFGPADG